MQAIDLGVIIAIVGCFVGLAGWLRGRDGKIETNSKWQGVIEGKLDSILGIKPEVADLRNKLEEQGKLIAVVDASAKSAHHRIDDHCKADHGKGDA